MTLAVALVLAGCNEAKPLPLLGGAARAHSQDHRLLYVVDSENDLVRVQDTKTHKDVAKVKVGRAPESVLVGGDDRIFVSNRGERSVSVIRRGTWKEEARIPVGVEPVGMALSDDEQTLYVAHGMSLEAVDKGSLAAIDLQELRKKWELPVKGQPSGVILKGKDRAEVLRRDDKPLTVDLAEPRVLDGGQSGQPGPIPTATMLVDDDPERDPIAGASVTGALTSPLATQR